MEDLTGLVFNDLTAIKHVGYTGDKSAVWLWKCVCGKEKEYGAHNVKREHTKSCGCRRYRVSAQFRLEHRWAEGKKATCSKCGQEKDHKEFRKQYRKHVAFPRAWCRRCDNENRNAAVTKSPETRLVWALRSIKNKCRDLRLPYDLTIENFLPIPGACPILGIPMGYDLEGDNRPSFDRVVPKLGYVKGNVNLISMRANRIKSDATLEELNKIAAYVEKHSRESLPT